MSASAAVLLLLAPMLREPVGLGDWHAEPDPLRRRVASLMVGEAYRSGAITVVPLFARVPSEAGVGGPPAPVWQDASLSGLEVPEDGRLYFRLLNPTDRPVFVQAGTVFRAGDREVFVARDAVVSADFAALLPARLNEYTARPNEPPDPEAAFERVGVLTPRATGLLLHGIETYPRAVLDPWRQRFSAPAFQRLRVLGPVARRARAVASACGNLPERFGRTAVGAVFLVGGRPVAAHVFATNELFESALRDLLVGVALQAAEQDQDANKHAALELFAARADAGGRARSFLRSMLRVGIEGQWTESYGEGFEALLLNEADRVVGHAVLDARRSVVHAGFYWLGDAWPGTAPASGASPVPPGRPETGGSEAPPGQVDRKARPSLAEARQRPRRPGPSTGGGRNR